ncbi:MAG: EAL domain-containing protein [Helicobacteraceae bacterium]|jgi:diguanylate cyclase (GGDEF)-like protein/PAS domain S-box-containing protein|nr:EAL domain-containing protein [Helicobacteraceae bacterium]
MRLNFIIRFLLPWAVMVILGVILFVLYVLSSAVSDVDRKRTELDLRQALTLNVQIDLDILRLRHRQLLIYDSLSSSTSRVDLLLEDIQYKFARFHTEDNFRAVRNSWNEKTQKIDDFKRQNSVLVNSIYHFINISNALSAAESKINNHQRIIINKMVRSILIFVSDQQLSMRDNAAEALYALFSTVDSYPPDVADRVKLLCEHGVKILDNHLPVQEIMEDIAKNSFVSDLSNAYAEFLEAFAKEEQKADNYRKLMTIFSLFMIIVVMAIVLRLQQIAQELLERNQFINNINKHLSEGVLSFDSLSRLSFANLRAEHFLGRGLEELIHQDWVDIFRFAEDPLNEPFKKAFENREHYEGEVWLLHASGDRYPALILGGPMPSVIGSFGVNSFGYVATFRDVTEQHEAQARLRLSAQVFESLSEGLVVTNSAGEIQMVNAAFSAITGYSEKEAIGNKPGALLASGQHGAEFYRDMWRALGKTDKWSGEIINRKKNGELYPEWLSITATRSRHSGKVQQFVALFTDVSVRKQAEEHIRRLSYYDPLTGLANRLLYGDRLENAIHQAHRNNELLAVIYLDLDRFKSVNDSLGHTAGDALLKLVSKRLIELMREGDTLARFGGDEFGMILNNIKDLKDVAVFARGILRTFVKPYELEGREIFCNTSVGIAIYPTDAERLEDLLKNADVALYRAKDSGRSNFKFFQESASKDFLAQLDLETALRHSVDRGELRLFYQPQVSSQTEKIYGVEALVRWQHPTLGLLPPDQFISIGENIGYIEKLGDWCLETACRQIVAWRAAKVPISRVAVNVSAKQLNNPKFMEKVMEIVRETGIETKYLELELTESSMTENPEKVMEIFSKLRATGIRVAIDDFGTGYSSLSYIARYPVDVLKIDKSFVQSIGEANDTSRVVKAIAMLAHSLSMEIVAEGVETEAQRDYLKSVGCELLQGFLYSKPVPREQLEQLKCVV